MCKFHQDIALDVARNPDGSLDPLSFAINSIALGTNFAIDDYVPAMPGISGYNTYGLASKEGQDAFAQSNLVYDPDAFEAYRMNTIGFLQERTKDIIANHAMDKKFTKKLGQGKKAIRFVNTIPDEAYASFDNLSSDIFKTDKAAALYQDIRQASAEYWNDPQTQEILEKRFEFSVANIFTEAKENANPLLLKTYEALPDVVKQYGDCAKGICRGVSISSVAHSGCIAKFAVLPALGASSTLTEDPNLTIGLMTGLSATGIGLWHYIHHMRGTIPNKLEKFSTYGTTLVTLGAVMAWHTLSHQADHTTDHEAEPKSRLYVDEQGREFLIQRNVICTMTGFRISQDTIPLQMKPVK